MRTLRVTNFSCITDAVLELGNLTVIVGPQASGKSVLCKLTYFFMNLLRDQVTVIAESKNIEGFKDRIRESFIEWFPVSAWGERVFNLSFEAGRYTIKLTRTSHNSKAKDNFRITLSPAFEQFFGDLSNSFQKIVEKSGGSENDYTAEYGYQVFLLSEEAKKRQVALLGDDDFDFQSFVPAGRAFFTSMGKTVLAFEHGDALDPLMRSFASSYTSLKQFMSQNRSSIHFDDDALVRTLIGGEIWLNGSKEYVRTSDSRKIPFSALSSGQQEILPLLLTLFPSGKSAFRRGRKQSVSKRFVYIEEPEAHLFPSAQSVLVSSLVSLMPSSVGDMVLTTHSPYVLAKINNLIFAGMLGTRLADSMKEKIKNIVAVKTWLAPGRVRAYAIDRGELKSIIDEEGLIDGEYLDDVSGDIAREFNQLQNIESANDSK